MLQDEWSICHTGVVTWHLPDQCCTHGWSLYSSLFHNVTPAITIFSVHAVAYPQNWPPTSCKATQRRYTSTRLKMLLYRRTVSRLVLAQVSRAMLYSHKFSSTQLHHDPPLPCRHSTEVHGSCSCHTQSRLLFADAAGSLAKRLD